MSCKSSHESLVQIGLPTGAPSNTGYESTEASRRDVLAMMGFSLGAASLAACRAPVQQAIPAPVASPEMVPGVSNFYATTCGGCGSACSLLVTQRDGRPIKIEGNDASTLFGGGTCAAGQATVLSLYDEARLRGPLWMGNNVPWRELDRRVTDILAAARGDGRRIVLLSKTLTSPSTRAVLDEFRAAYPTFRHVVYEPVSLTALRSASERVLGRPVVPHYRFDKARIIVGLEADFLGTWLSPVEFARQYATTRTKDDSRSFHVQFEAGVSVTGTNADLRVLVAPADLGALALALLAALAHRGVGRAGPDLQLGTRLYAPPSVDQRQVDRVAEMLARHRGESLVVSGSDDPATQIVVAAINMLLGNVGVTLDVDRPSLQNQGDDTAVASLIDEMERGDVRVLLLWGANPVYDHPNGAAFAKALEKPALTISFSDRRDETSRHVHAVCPDHHFLESWGDAEPVAGHYSLAQPLIAPLFDTRAAQSSLLRWAGQPDDHHTWLKTFWRRRMLPRAGAIDFDAFWDRTLQTGVVELPPEGRTASGTGRALAVDTVRGAAEQIVSENQLARAALGGSAGQRGAARASFELALHENVALRDGRLANNPWLLELPDPITRLTWGNVAAVSPSTAATLGLANGDVITLSTETGNITLPAFVQPGQQPRTISVAVGYGRWAAGKAADGVGANAFPLTTVTRGVRRSTARVVVAKTGRRVALATTQPHLSMEGRPIVQQTTLAALGEASDHQPEALPDIWAARLPGAHRWGMAIDLDACTGCSACVVACQAENNVPVVGVEQVRKNRVMHWLRIDRYYDGPEDDPAIVHQPMMCQHCGHAPCETVCPVVATTTSSEGINQQVYNRCIGTRYCANNCPYKVRRFNWHNYTSNPDFAFNMHSPLGALVLNPDVTVRTRGVMEKCNLCVQRIQLGKNQALKEKRPIADGDVRTACQQSCPTGAIVFGDLQDPDSRASKLLADRRAYKVLEDLGTRPGVGYLKKIRNPEPT